MAIDEPFGDHHSDAHDRDYIYLVWVAKDDLAELVRRIGDEVSYREAGICDDLDAFMAAWHEIKEVNDC